MRAEVALSQACVSPGRRGLSSARLVSSAHGGKVGVLRISTPQRASEPPFVSEPPLGALDRQSSFSGVGRVSPQARREGVRAHFCSSGGTTVSSLSLCHRPLCCRYKCAAHGGECNPDGRGFTTKTCGCYCEAESPDPDVCSPRLSLPAACDTGVPGGDTPGTAPGGAWAEPSRKTPACSL